MRKVLIIIYLTFVFAQIIHSQPYFDIGIDIGYEDNPTGVISDDDGNIFISGWYTDSSYTSEHAFVLKLNSLGVEQWRITYDEQSKFHGICITQSGDVVLAGSRFNYGFLTMIDSNNGSQIWLTTDSLSNGYWYSAVNEVYSNNNYRLHAANTTTGLHPIQIIAFDALTGIIVDTILDINSIDNPIFLSSQIVPEQLWFACEGLVICNSYNSFCGLWLFNTIHIAGIDPYSPDKGCIVRLFEWLPEEYYIGVLTMTIEGHHVYGNAFELLHEDFIVSGSGILASESILVTGSIGEELSLWMISHDLTKMVERIYSNSNQRLGIDVMGLPSNDILIIGNEYHGNSGSDIFLLKLDSNGTVVTPEITKNDNYSIYPNPTNKEFILNNANNNKVDIQILSLQGKIIKSVSNPNRPISIENLESGHYIVKITKDGKEVVCKKLIKL